MVENRWPTINTKVQWKLLNVICHVRWSQFSVPFTFEYYVKIIGYNYHSVITFSLAQSDHIRLLLLYILTVNLNLSICFRITKVIAGMMLTRPSLLAPKKLESCWSWVRPDRRTPSSTTTCPSSGPASTRSDISMIREDLRLHRIRYRELSLKGLGFWAH